MGLPSRRYAATGASPACRIAFDRGQSATTWTTVDRPVPVTVTVPNSYDAQAQWVIGFSAPVAGSLTAVDTVPSGCKG